MARLSRKADDQFTYSPCWRLPPQDKRADRLENKRRGTSLFSTVVDHFRPPSQLWR
jgi:hypothetical protein